MDIQYSEEQAMLRDSVRKFVEQDYDFDSRRKIVAGDQAASDANWRLFAELGWLTIPFTEEDGGFGGNAVDIAIMMEEFGKGLVVEPFMTSLILAGGLFSRVASPQQKADLLGPLMDGGLKLALAFNEPQSRYELADVKTSAVKKGDSYVVSGHKCVVLHGDTADKFIAVVRTSGEQRDEKGISLLLIDRDCVGLRRKDYPTIDGQRAAELYLDNVEVPREALLGEEGEAFPALSDALDRAALAVCAEAVGAMEAALWKTVAYTQQRKQFGVPIAKFQALRHRMVEMYIECEQARSIVLMANLTMDSNSIDSSRAVSAAKYRLGVAAKRVAEEAVQLHGAIGVSEEYEIGHYLKRLTAIQYSFGSTDHHKQRYIKLSHGQK